MTNNHYDVIVIGGRCAGASLALWLADSDLRILLLDRATFPSLPNVPSAPFIHVKAMCLLDELGLKEADYAHRGSKIEQFIIDFADGVHAVMPLSRLMLERNYFRGIDRKLFDEALWTNAGQLSGVTAREGFAVTKILKDAESIVTGIFGKTSGGDDESYSADLIVGADGRFSFSARQFGANVIEEKNDHTSAVYLAEWDDVHDYSPDYPNAITTYNTGKGFMVLVIPIAERKYHIGSAMRSADAHFGAQGVEAAYIEGLQGIPQLWNRLKDAQRVTDVVGMRPIENGYREAFGANWALVGDAVHYKDPSDGQGVYDALLESKLLAQSICDWKQKGIAWMAAGANYQQNLMDATHPRFEQTVANVKQTLYVQAPSFVFKTMGRWLMSDAEFQTQFLRYLNRDLDIPPSLSPKILVNGLVSDMRNRFKADKS